MSYDKDDREEKNYEIPAWRKALYYGGMILTVIGFAVFFIQFFKMFTDPFNTRFSFGNSFVGMILAFVGQITSNVGRKGLAGSGLKLDPKSARKDYEPFTRAGGGMIADAYDEFKSESKLAESNIKIRCRNCEHLNDENANFCNNCGEKL